MRPSGRAWHCRQWRMLEQAGKGGPADRQSCCTAVHLRRAVQGSWRQSRHDKLWPLPTIGVVLRDSANGKLLPLGN